VEVVVRTEHGNLGSAIALCVQSSATRHVAFGRSVRPAVQASQVGFRPIAVQDISFDAVVAPRQP